MSQPRLQNRQNTGSAYLGQQDAVLAQQGGAAGAQGGLAAEVGHDGHQAVPQALDHHALRDARHQAQRVDAAADVVQQRTCSQERRH